MQFNGLSSLITFGQELLYSIIDAFNEVVKIFNTPILDDVGYFVFEGTWFGDKIIELLGKVIPPDLTYLGLMFGSGIAVLIVITVVKWIIGIVM